MQYILIFIVLLLAVGFVLYKISGKFEKRELFILFKVIIISISLYFFYENSQEKKLPKLFEEKYKEVKNINIENLSYKLLNNKDISSPNYFIYSFTYIISKNETKYLCSLPKVEINKVGNEFIFSNFEDLQETCKKQ